MVCWAQLAENVAQSLTRGSRVVVTGRLDQRSWETDQGEKRSKIEITADEVAPSLRWATVEVTKNERRSPEAATVSTGAFSGTTVNVTQPARVPIITNVTFAPSASGDTITRTGGSWSAVSGFGTNSQIEITNAGSNNGSYTVATVSGAVITLQEHDRVQPNTLTTTSLFFTDSGAYKIRRTDALQWVAKTSFVVASPGDSWIAVCAIATAAELKLKALVPDISKVGARAGQETVEVARAAAAALG